MKRWIPFAVAALTVTACQDASGPASQLRPVVLNLGSASGSVPIAGSYIVKFRDDMNGQDVDNSARTLVKLHHGALTHVYRSVLKGFAVQNLSAAAAATLANDPRVEFIEPDQVMSASTTQTGATWGLDRVDQRTLPLNGLYTYNADGSGVTVYIIDTGINFTHPDLEGRASKGIDEITTNGTAADCNGHGTHVSGTVAGKTYGVAKKAKLVAVRVLDCSGSGTSSGVIAGIDWVTANKTLPAAANMSLGGGKDVLLNQAVARSVAAGVTYAVAAGNSAADACASSPSSEPSAITVGATDNTDAFAYFSNFGSCVDINAPGVNVTSDWLGTGTNTISGTSMASPHVTGAAALYLSANPTATPAQVTSALTGNASPFPAAPSGTPKILVYTGFIAAPTTPVISLSPTSFTFSGNLGGANPPSQNLSITNSGVGTLNWTATTTPSAAWLSVSPAAGTAPSTAVVSVNTSGLAAGNYSGTITVSASGATDQTATVNLTVVAPPSAPSQLSPANGATGVSIPATLSWGAATGATSYRVQVSAGTSVGPTYVYDQIVSGTSTSVSGLSPSATYTWHVTANNSAGSATSAPATFTTAAAPLTTVTISPATTSVAVGRTVTLRATTNPTGRAVTWSSSNTAIATVSTSGVVTGKAAGSATITATAADGGKGTATVTVTAPCTDGNCQN